MMSRGYSLIELMISVALVSIVVSGAYVALEAPAAESVELVVTERARQWLEYEADCASRGAAPDPAVRDAFQRALPSGRLTLRPVNPRLVQVILEYTAARRPRALDLMIVRAP